MIYINNYIKYLIKIEINVTIQVLSRLPLFSCFRRAPLSPEQAQALEHEKIKKLFTSYNWDTKLVDNHPACAEFLKRSGALFSIRAFQVMAEKSQHTSELKLGIRTDTLDSHPLLLKDGQWTRWEALEKELVLNEYKEIVSRSDPENIWNYLYPQGFVAQERNNHVFPVHKLNTQEMEDLKAHAAPLRTSEDQTYYLQVVTTGPSKVSHASLRLIDENGDVYSLGFETRTRDVSADKISLFSTLATFNVTIASLDFAEFEKFGFRRVTTIPINQQMYAKAKDKIITYTKQPLRFNFLHQNCSTFVADILKTVGKPVDIRTTALEFLLDLALPNKVAQYAKQFFSWVYKKAPRCIKALTRIVIWVPGKCLTIFRNLFICVLGGSKEGNPPVQRSDHRNNENELATYDRLISNLSDLANESIGTISSSAKLAVWQEMQPTTYRHSYDGSPRLYIVPQKTGTEAQTEPLDIISVIPQEDLAGDTQLTVNAENGSSATPQEPLLNRA